MAVMKSHPAIFAGLLGSAAWGVPKIALATPIDDIADAVAGSLVLQFVVGCAAGAAIAGGIAFVVERVAPIEELEELDREEESELEDDRWSSSSLNLMRAMEKEADEDPTGDLGRYRTGQITIDFPVITEEAVASGPRHARKPRHAAPAAAVRMVPRASGKRIGRHFAGAEEQVVVSIVSAPEVPALRGRHFAAPTAAVQEERKLEGPKPEESGIVTLEPVAPVVEPLAEGAVQPLPARVTPNDELRARLAQLPSIESRYAKPVRPAVEVSSRKPVAAVAPIAKDVVIQPEAKEALAADTSSSVTNKLRLRDRVAARTKNVREVLASRLAPDSLNVLPIIPRADGTTMDVGPAWFGHTLAPALASLTGGMARIDDTATRDDSTPQVTSAMMAEGESDRASYISRHVAEVNVGMFPERRSADELENDDIWEEALAAMGEAIAQESPNIFHDMVGGPSTIDDPDGLEGPTGFIPFRVPAAHPEVVDTETYVDYLLRDELSHNSSLVMRRSPHAHLRVIEGGTGAMRMRRRPGDTGAAFHTGRHFASPQLAQEA